MTTAEKVELIRLIVEGLVGGLLVAVLTWLLFSLKSIWAAQKDLMQQRIELLKSQMPAAQELAAEVEIHKELLEAQKTQLERQIAQKDEAHRQELEQKLADIMALQDQIKKYEEAEQRRKKATAEAIEHALNILSFDLAGEDQEIERHRNYVTEALGKCLRELIKDAE